MRCPTCLAMVLLLAAGCGKANRPVERPPRAGDPRLHALLVGCTRYEHLPERLWLKGPANDVQLLADLLMDRFGFRPENVRILAEGAGRDNRPVRANIQRELQRLAQTAGPDHYVVVYLSGHGSKQPDQDPADPEDVELDGLDEVFCPADITRAQPEGDAGIPNAVCDDELRVWLGAIRATGASVWAIVDACHSGTMTRGGVEVARQLPPESLIPAEALNRARERAARNHPATRGRTAESLGMELSERKASDGGFVATYAAQPWETTPEKSLPADSADRRRHGLFTYTLVQVLSQARTPVSYGELIERIQRRYVADNRLGPTPTIEGPDRDRAVLGQRHWPGCPAIVLHRVGPDRLTVNAGALHGLSLGSVLEVLNPGETSSDQAPLGHVCVTQVRTADSDVVSSTAEGRPRPNDLPDGAPCRPAHAGFGEMPLRVALLAESSKTPLSPVLQTLQTALLASPAKPTSILQLVDDADQANWLVRQVGNDLCLVPAEGWADARSDEDQRRFGPVPANLEAVDWLEERLTRIARARHLLGIAGRVENEQAASATGRAVDVRLEMLRLENETDPNSTVVRPSRGMMQLHAHDIIRLRVSNVGKLAADITLLFVDSGYGIECLFPPPETRVYNRLAPGETMAGEPLVITATTLGLEHVVLVAVAGQGETVDFGWLAQPGLEQVPQSRGVAMTSPLELSLRNELFGRRAMRGVPAARAAQPMLRVISWHTVDGQEQTFE